MSGSENKGGRPPVEIDLEQLGALCRMKPTLKDCAAFFKCSPSTIELRIKEKTGLSFKDFRAQFLVHTKFDLIRQAIKRAHAGDKDMMKLCLKNLSDWSERESPEVVVNNNVVNLHGKKDEELLDELKKLDERLLIDVTPKTPEADSGS